MGDRVITGIVAILTAIIGIAIIAVLVSQKSNTANVLTAGGNAFAGIIRTAVAPVSGGGGSIIQGLIGPAGLNTGMGSLG